MARWIRICAWVLIAFAAPGVVYSLVMLDWLSLLINIALIIIGALDLKSLQLTSQNPPRAWRRIAYTQFALGVIIGLSFYYAGHFLVKPEHWDMARGILEKVQGPLPDFLWDDAVARSQLVMSWGTALGGVAIFLGQWRLSWKISQIAKRSQPPPLPKDSSSEKH
ncbi:hypothetical protein [Cerasicoccus frondis]|uniref:hypothetical protein n=1 Tax=Cerasicoccus frondis TaxID=490090 RepID=UPI002852CD00|nr:hypothetical protein [Cerasicoccus frondis]